MRNMIHSYINQFELTVSSEKFDAARAKGSEVIRWCVPQRVLVQTLRELVEAGAPMQAKLKEEDDALFEAELAFDVFVNRDEIEKVAEACIRWGMSPEDVIHRCFYVLSTWTPRA